MKKKQKRILALLLALLCFLASPMSVYASVGAGGSTEAQEERSAGQGKSKPEETDEVSDGKTEAAAETAVQTETERKQETEPRLPSEIWTETETGSERESGMQTDTEENPGKETERNSVQESETFLRESDEGKQSETSVNLETEVKQPETSEEEKGSERKIRAAAAEGIYLTARKKASTLDKVTAVTIGNVNTQIPEGYEGYVRTVSAIETNFSSQSFVPDKGALKGKEGCISLSGSDKNKYYAWYRKSMYYQGQWLDIRMTLTDFELRNGAMFRFVPNRPGIETYKVEWADVKMEFFRSDTKAAVSVKGYVTFRDIDLFQGIVLKEGFGKVYAGAETLPNLRVSVVNSRNYYYDISGVNQTSADKGFMLSALISGASAWMTFTFVRPENDLGTSLTPSGGISAESYKIFSSAHPHIEKYVSDSDEKMVGINTLSGKDEIFTYTLATMVPMETEGTVYQDWSIRDKLDDYLEIRQVSVTNENGTDASGYWNINADSTFLAQCRNIRDLGFYGHTYFFQITVGIKKEVSLKNRWDTGTRKAVIRNQAHVTSDGKTVDSRTVITTIPTMPSSVLAEKRDSLTGRMLSGAEFSIYEWKQGTYGETPLAVLKNGENGVYESGEILNYTAENQGKFKLVETKPPKGYKKAEWEKKFTISGFEKEKIAFQGEDACEDEPQWIRIRVKKIDSETGKALKGAVFAVYQWSEQEKQYVSFETADGKIEELVTGEDGVAVSGRLFYQEDNQGKFRVQEKQPPERYFGDYREEDPQNGMKTYDFQVREENDGQILTLSNIENGEVFANTPKKAAIAVKKTGEVLQSAQKTEDGMQFRYREVPLPGAKYQIIAAEDIYRADGVTRIWEKGAVADEIETGNDGRAVSRMLYSGKYNVVEVKAPGGYVLGRTTEETSRMVDLDCSMQKEKELELKELTFRNARPKAAVTVWKKSEDTKVGLAGAVFGLYAGEAVRVNENIIVEKGTLLAQAVSNADGACRFGADIPCGYSYYVKEIQAPENYGAQAKEKVYAFNWQYQDDQTLLYEFPKEGEEKNAVFYNSEVRAEILLQKLDAESGLPKPQQEASLDGAVYGLYAAETIWSPDGTKKILYEKDTEVSRETTDGQGRICFGQVPLGKYYVKEIKASKGYLADAGVYRVDCAYEGQEKLVVKRSLTSREHVKKQKIRCFKLTGDNKETDLAWMAGAGFSIYSVSDLEEADGVLEGSYAALSEDELVQKMIDTYRDKETLDYSSMKELPTALIYDEHGNAQRVGELYSDEEGVLESPLLAYGHYLLVETTVPKGKTAAAPKVIVIDSDVEDAFVKGDGNGAPLSDFAIWDQPKTSYLKITKEDAFTGRRVAKAGTKYVIHDMEGAYFRWYMEDKTSQEKTDYRNRFGDLAVAYTNGDIAGSYEKPYETEVRKDADGRNIGTYVATTEPLPAGLYILEEVEAPQGYVKQGFEGMYRTRNGSTFFEAAALQLPEWETVRSLALSADDVGKWDPAEKASKDRRIRILIGSENESTGYDRLAGHFVTEVCQANDPVVGKLSIYAEGQVLKGFDAKKGFEYEYRGAPGNEFTVRAAENIYSGEGGENQTLLFAKGSQVVRLVTDSEGKAWTGQMEAAGFSWHGLPLGIYTVEQTKAGEGFVLTEENRNPRTFEISYAGQEIPIVYQNAVYDIPKQKAHIQVSKQDAENKNKLAGAVFGLYAGQDIFSADGRSVLVEKDTLLELAETRAGAKQVENAVFDLDLPPAFYYIREEKAPDGYYLSSRVCNVDARYRSEGGEFLEFTEVFQNHKTMLQVNFMDYETEVELDDVHFSVLDEDGGTVCSEISVHNNNIWIRGLEPGRPYRIQVTKARNSYHWNIYEKEGYLSPYPENGYATESGYFTVKEQKPIKIKGNQAEIVLDDKECVQVVSLFHKSVQGSLHICKEGEVPRTRLSNGKLLELQYELQGLPGAAYDIFAKEEVLHPDGYSNAIYRAGERIDRLVTDADGEAVLSGLYAGKYEVIEKKAPAGYTRDAQACSKTMDMCQKDSSCSHMEARISFENPRQRPDIGQDPDGEHPDSETIINDDLKGKTGIMKIGVDGENQTKAEGAEFTLYAKKDITDVSGRVVIPEGTEIERAVSDASGRAAFTADLPMGSYAVKETRAAEGYYLSAAEIVFDFEPYRGDDRISIVRMQGTVKNAVTRAKLFLKDDRTGNELAGAVLQVSDESGRIHTVIHTENTEGAGHLILGLIPGKTYKIAEIMPRSGYTSEIHIPDSMQGILKRKGRSEVTFSIPEVSTDADLENLPGRPVIEIENAFLTGKVCIAKKGELLNTADRQVQPGEKLFNFVKTCFGYLAGDVQKAEFSVFAEKDIYHPDGVTGILFHAGELVECRVREKEKLQAVAFTDAAGSAEFYGLYLGQYTLKETNIPEGYRKNDKSISFTLADGGEDKDPVLPKEGTIPVYNERQQVDIQVIKRDRDTVEKVLPGAVFGLYAGEDICTKSGKVLLEADTLLETQKTDADGKVQFDHALPNGKYYIAELKAPGGYVSSDEKIQVDASWKEDGAAVQTFRIDFTDEITKVNIVKKAKDTGESMAGAKLAVYQGNTCVESWTTEEKAHCVKGLEAGTAYVLREIAPAPGYVTARDVPFVVEDAVDGVYRPQEVVMEDDITEVHISVFELDGGKKTSLGRVKAHLETADGKKILADGNPSGKGGAWESRTGEEEIWKKLPVGKYKVVADSVPEGYVLPESTRIEVKDTAQIQYFEIIVRPIIIRITGYAQASSVAADPHAKSKIKGIYAHIAGMFGEKSEELLAVYRHVPKGRYEIVTDQVPSGYVLPSEKVIEVRGDTAEIQDFEISVRPTVIKITAVDKKTQAALDGVKVTVMDENGRTVWKKTALTALKEKVIPMAYTIKTEKVPKGYEKPQNKIITVKAVSGLQKYKIELTKKEEDKKKTSSVDTAGGKVTQEDGKGQGTVYVSDPNVHTAAKTQDGTDAAGWIMTNILAVFCIFVMRRKRKKISGR